MKIFRSIALGFLVVVIVLLGVLAGLIVFGGPGEPAPLKSISAPFTAVDFSGLPPITTFRASDGQNLAYRMYAPQGSQKGSVTLVHGSCASSNSMHPLARALAAAGYRVFALDIRGHGESGPKGHIAYIGQLESDLADFVHAVQPPQPSTLAGFSSGGGFVLRIAGGQDQSLFGSYLLLAPFLNQDAPNERPQNGGWVSVGIPRIVGLSILNAAHVHAFNGLPVITFALDEHGKSFLTPAYDFNLEENFRPQQDYRANLAAVTRPCAIVDGSADELFQSDQLQGIIRSAGKDWPIDLVPNVGHIALTLDPAPIDVIVRRVGLLQQAK